MGKMTARRKAIAKKAAMTRRDSEWPIVQDLGPMPGDIGPQIRLFGQDNRTHNSSMLVPSLKKHIK